MTCHLRVLWCDKNKGKEPDKNGCAEGLGVASREQSPCTERYARWCERTAVSHRLLLDYGMKICRKSCIVQYICAYWVDFNGAREYNIFVWHIVYGALLFY